MYSHESREMKVVHIGFDDTDSQRGRCTTNLAYKISCKLKNEMDSIFVDYPLLVRLNPNIPWKTRGNGAVCLRVKSNQPKQIIEYVLDMVRRESDMSNGANPGVAVLEGEDIPLALRQFSSRAMYDVIDIKDTESLAAQHSIQTFKFGEGLGIIGAVASIGSLLECDHTYEAIAYRKKQFCGSPREIDRSKVLKINTDTFPFTFNSYDSVHNRVLVTPHGPDPVFCGIRGEDPFTVIRALEYILPGERLDGYMVFRTNQGTNMHLQNDFSLKKLKSHNSGYMKCLVTKRPAIIRGGHVFFEVSNFNNIKYQVAVYEPTGLGKLASKLIEGDYIDIGISVSNGDSNGLVLNIEYLSILNIVDDVTDINPLCFKCKKRMKSEGKNKGFQCKICGDKSNSKLVVTNSRDLQCGTYLPNLKAHRHLTKPLHRFGMEKTYPYLPNMSRHLNLEWIKSY